MNEFEDILKKCSTLDNELNVFFRSLEEIKSLRNSASEITEKLRKDEAEVETRKKEMEILLSSTSNILISFEEQAKGLFFDLEKKTDALANDVRASISELRDIFEMNGASLTSEQKEKIELASSSFGRMKDALESIHETMNRHSESISVLKNNYSGLLKKLEGFEGSLKEIRASLINLHLRPDDTESRIKTVEQGLSDLFFRKLETQKKIILTVLALMFAMILLFIYYPK